MSSISGARNLWGLQGQKLLIIDDLPQVRTMLREMLTSFGATDISSASTGEQALDLLSGQRFDLVVADYNLGLGKDGQQVLEEAREFGLLPYSSIFVLITAENTMDMVMGVVEQEPDAYIAKPFTREELRRRLQRAETKKRHFQAASLAMERRDYLQAAQRCARGAADYPEHRLDFAKLQGEALLKAQDAVSARDHYAGLLDERELPWAYFGLGRSLQALKDFPGAEEACRKALELRPHYVAALDCIAQCQRARGDSKAAESTLSEAVALSPKNIRRQQALGQLAIENEHFDQAESAFKSAVRQGKTSRFARPGDFGGLARSYLSQGDNKRAKQAVGQMGRRFEDADGPARLEAAIAASGLHRELGDDAAAQAETDRAIELFDRHGEQLPKDQAMSLAEACFARGDTDAGARLVQHVVRADHEDEAMLAKAQQLFASAGMDEAGAKLIRDEKQALIKLNNEGVELARNGKLRESVTLLLKAAKAMPENVAINLNAAQCILMLLGREPDNAPLLNQAKALLRDIRDAAENDKRYPQLLEACQAMERQNTSNAAA